MLLMLLARKVQENEGRRSELRTAKEDEVPSEVNKLGL